MVGVESEKEASVRKFCRLFIVGSSISVPFFNVTTRKGYGLGAMAMAGGEMIGQHDMFSVSWPTGEFGGMGLEGAVKLGYTRELAEAREKGGEAGELAEYNRLLAAQYQHGKALTNTLSGELDEVIDPADTRKWLLMGLEANPAPPRRRHGKKRPGVSAW